MNTRHTRRAENKKLTPKQALPRSKSKKEADIESVKSIQSDIDADSDKYILKIAKQQSKQKK